MAAKNNAFQPGWMNQGMTVSTPKMERRPAQCRSMRHVVVFSTGTCSRELVSCSRQHREQGPRKTDAVALGPS